MYTRARLLAACCCVLVVTPALFAAADYWDPRLNQICGLKLVDVWDSVAGGQGYWRLTRAEFQDEQQAGGTHHIYYMVLDESGNPIENQKTWASWPYDSDANTVSQLTKGPADGYWANFGMSGTNYTPCNWPFNAWIDTASSPKPGHVGPSDRVCGMGMTNPNGTAAHAHVSFRLYYRWTVKPLAGPLISRSPASFSHSIVAGETLLNDSFTISNSGGGTLSYSISDDTNWLSVNPTSGATSGPANTHAVAYSVADLPTGIYSATITITATGCDNSPQTVGVTVLAKPSIIPGDMDGDMDVDQTDFGLLQVCLTASGGSQLDPACVGARLDVDSDVDANDVDIFIGCFSGPGVQGNPNCN